MPALDGVRLPETTTRVYHYLSAQYAEENVVNGRLKISTLGDVNDPFELRCMNLVDPAQRTLVHRWATEMGRKFGFHCFSTSWQETLMWSHYADKHKGVVLGLDVPADRAMPVRYVAGRTLARLDGVTDEATMQECLFTKYRGWAYEKEVRVYASLNDADARGLYFSPMGESLALREIYLGERCDRTVGDVAAWVRGRYQGVKVVQARLAFQSYRVVRRMNVPIVSL